MQPLSGLLVLDFTTLLPGPLATLMLAEAGAEVIKIERPGGEDMRRFPPMVDGESAVFALLNRGKKLLTLDLKNEREKLIPLIKRADILVEQFRPGVMARLGLGYDDVRKLNPKLIYCSISGYGQSGPREQEAGHDINYIGNTGLLDLQPGPIAAPVVPPMLVADIAGGSFPAVINILLALRARDQSGQGCHLDIAMSDAMFTFAWYALALGAATGKFPKPGELTLAGGSPRYQLYATKDGKLVACGAIEQKFWLSFTGAIGLAKEFIDDARAPMATRDAVAKLIAARTADEWRPIFAKADCCTTIVVPLEQAMRDPHFVERGLFAHEVASSAGKTIPALPLPIAPEFRGKPGVKESAAIGQELDRFTAHEPRLRSRRRHAFAHQRAAQGADAVDEIEPQTARALNGEEIGEQRAIDQIDGERAGADIGAAHFVVAREHIDAADIVTGAMRRDGELADGGGIAQPEIEPLRADRRDDMGGFADQRDALGGEIASQSRPTMGIRHGPARPQSCRGSNAKRARSRPTIRHRRVQRWRRPPLDQAPRPGSSDCPAAAPK